MGRGGARPGAGRKRTGTVKTTITIDRAVVQKLDEVFRAVNVQVTHSNARTTVPDGLRELAAGTLILVRKE